MLKKFKLELAEEEIDIIIEELEIEGNHQELVYNIQEQFDKTNNELEKETEKGVTWQEAFEAGLNGKKIKVYGQYLTYPKFETLHFALNYLSIRPTYYKDMLKKEWYIEQD